MVGMMGMMVMGMIVMGNDAVVEGDANSDNGDSNLPQKVVVVRILTTRLIPYMFFRAAVGYLELPRTDRRIFFNILEASVPRIT